MTRRKSVLERMDTLQRIVELSKLGLHNDDIANIIGCAPDTLEKWHRQGVIDCARGKRLSKYARVYLAIERNRSEHFRETLADLKKQSASGNDRASRLLLEQSPKYRHDTQITVRLTAEKLGAMSTEELLQLRQGRNARALLTDDT